MDFLNRVLAYVKTTSLSSGTAIYSVSRDRFWRIALAPRREHDFHQKSSQNRFEIGPGAPRGPRASGPTQKNEWAHSKNTFFWVSGRKREAPKFFFSAPRLFWGLFGGSKIVKNACFSCLFFRARFSTLLALILGGPDP